MLVMESPVHEVYLSFSSNVAESAVDEIGKKLPLLVSYGGETITIPIINPFDGFEEREYQWYLEDFASKQPFAASRAAKVERSLKRYVKSLAAALLKARMFPRRDKLKLIIDCSLSSSTDAEDLDYSSTLQRLHWELLEDASHWPDGARFESILVCRTVSNAPRADQSNVGNSRISILLITCRPKGRDDIDALLISRSILKTAQAAAAYKGNGSMNDVRLEILRPPTWLAFKEHLLYDREPGHYHIVHFDMHGEILDADKRYAK